MPMMTPPATCDSQPCLLTMLPQSCTATNFNIVTTPVSISTLTSATCTPPGEFCLLPTFRLPTLIHTRSGAAKWLNEIAQCNPLWVYPADGKRLGLADGDLVRVETEIGYFVDRVWLTEGIRPGVVACSHHLGRWRRRQDAASNRYSANVVDVTEQGPGKWLVRQLEGPGPFVSADPDSQRIWWREGGVPQNLT